MGTRGLRQWGKFLTVAAVAIASLGTAGLAQSAGYQQTNLVSDQAGVATFTDPLLVNSWGVIVRSANLLEVANAETGTSTFYHPDGSPAPSAAKPLVVVIPGAEDGGEPTGLVSNTTSDFVISQGGRSASASVLFASEDGTISGWNPAVNQTEAVIVVNNSDAEAVYKGLAIGSNGAANFLFAANFRGAVVEIYDGGFHFVRSFTDAKLPAGFAPFNIWNIGGRLYVMFAKQDPENTEEDLPGPGNGFVDVFDTAGTLVRRLISGGPLNSPWGLALAPATFGQFSNALLVGNFGDGWINAFVARNGAFLGSLRNVKGAPIAIDGLWGLDFLGSDLYFAAGPDDETHGLFGKIVVAH
jgi:uncharacterized protein (TIGR03118 family)